MVLRCKAGSKRFIKIQGDHVCHLSETAVFQQAAHYLWIDPSGVEVACCFSGKAKLGDEVYGVATEFEQKEFMRAFIERIDLYPEKQKDGNWIRNIVFNFPVPVNGQEVTELPLESGTMLETIVLLQRETL